MRQALLVDRRRDGLLHVADITGSLGGGIAGRREIAGAARQYRKRDASDGTDGGLGIGAARGDKR
jgi:hypothetical protein